LRARTLFALGLVLAGLACAPALAVAATGGAGVPDATARKAAPTDAPQQDQGTPAEQPPADTASGGARAGAVPPQLHPTVPGDVGEIRDGIAYAPAAAPIEVQRAIWAANKLQHKPYVYGGGHRSFRSRGYDCSGTVSFALHAAGLIQTPMDSSDFMSWGQRGKGAWITVYTNPGHAWAIIAGLRLDTSGPGESGPRWRTETRSTRGFRARHPESL
jgi:cell wall-associated NlpC family hydrolase